MDYTEITDAGRAYADRVNDPEIEANLDIFLRLGEARLSRLLKVRKASVRATLIVNSASEYYALPTDFGGMRDVQVNTQSNGTSKKKTLSLLNPEQFELKAQETSNNDLRYYNIIAEQIRITSPGDNETLEIAYYQRIPQLTSQVEDIVNNLKDETNNWVSIDHPDIYLSLLMFEIELFTKNYEAADGWESRLMKAIDDLKVTDSDERWSGTPMTTRTDFHSGNRRP